MPTFAAFYRAINGRDPFPWQSRLADQVAATERWPDEVGVPTGLGKTACLDIAVWWLASQADRPPAKRTAPTRIWWIVNRRLLIDATTEHAEAIACALRAPSADVAATVADRLRSLAAVPADPLEVIRLRGGVPTRRPTDPSQPAIVLATLPMYGSRLLFRGYGSFRSMRPIDAALAGTDSLVMLDEAHLAPHLRRLLPALAECTPGARPVLGHARSRPTMVALTATGDAAAGGSRFDLDACDEAHPVVRQRLDARKPMEVQRAKSGEADRLIAKATHALIADAPSPTACVVFANTPATARAVFNRLQDMAENEAAELLLLTGRVREQDAERTRQRILDSVHGMAAARAACGRQRHLIVVATQTLEVGADIDAELLVTEACGVRALTQRLGRLNRLGRYPRARAVYVHVPPPAGARRGTDEPEWPVYGSEPATVLRRLDAAVSRDGTVNLSPRRIAEILGAPCDDSGRAPEVLHGLLWEWVKTTTPPAGEAPVDPYFSGIAALEYSVSLIWRAYVPAAGELLWPRATDRETVDVPIGEARAVFRESEVVRRLAPDGVTVETTPMEDLRPGDTIVLASDRGLLDEFGWAPGSTASVVDLSIAEHGVPLDAAAIKRLCGVTVDIKLVDRARGTTGDDEDLDAGDRAEAAALVLEAVADAPTPPGWEEAKWSELVADLQPSVVTARNEVERLLRGADQREPRSDELDELSWADTAVELDRHGEAVAMRARSIADRLGIAPELAAVVERAGRSHDLGKADRRFQRWLDPGGNQPVPVAKSRMPRSQWNGARAAAGWPKGGRHEELSARLVRRWLERQADPLQAALLVHLVVSHHGSGRPLVMPVDDSTAVAVSAEIEGASVDASADLSTIDWGQPVRFRRLNDQLGPWGLALLEAIVRQADHAVSGETEVR